MKVALCCIGRLENRYAVEYVEWYKKLGIDKIFIYDNNYDGEEHFEDVLQPYIDEGLVDIIDFRNKSVCQLEAYQDCYNNHNNEFDWICFFDFGDEYLYMNDYTNIKDFLSQYNFNGYEVIHINRMNYGDNDLVYYEDKKLSERFLNPIMPLDFVKDYNFPENDHISSIVRGGLEHVEWKMTPHTPSNQLKCCDASGKEQKSESPFVHPFDFSHAHLKHYTTKSLQEFLEIKVKRGYPDGNKDYFKNHNALKEYFKLNKITDEKIKYINGLVMHNEHEHGMVEKYITLSDLSNTIRKNIWKIPRDIDFIIGIPRSGMIAASFISDLLNVPLIDINSFLSGLEPYGGMRLGYFTQSHKNTNKVLVIDDTVSSGRAMNATRQKIEASGRNDLKFIYACIYLEGWGKDSVDIYLEDVREYTNNFTTYVLYEWNIFQHHSDVMKDFIFDIDGVFCVDPPDERNENEYISYIKNPNPLFIPKTKIGGIITYRLNKNRKITEEWLGSQGIRYNQLIMINADTWDERNKFGIMPEVYKGDFYKNSNYKLFIESSDYQAKRIFDISRKPVYCVETNKLYSVPRTNTENNLDLFIGTHKPFVQQVKNSTYKVIYGNKDITEQDGLTWLKCTSNEPLDDRFYSEIYMLKNLPKDWKLKKYVGFCHYRKYFEFLDNIPNLDEIFNEYDAIMIRPTKFNISVREQYAKHHNIEDLEIVEDIIKNYFNEYYEACETVLNGDSLHLLNMFIMKKEDFNNYIKFIDDVLQKYIERVGVDIKKRIEDNKEKYLKDFSPNDTVDYQYRIGGYLAERLTNVFAEKHFKNIKTYKVKITEYKY